jgi:hypothetical protein
MAKKKVKKEIAQRKASCLMSAANVKGLERYRVKTEVNQLTVISVMVQASTNRFKNRLKRSPQNDEFQSKRQ